MSKLVSLESIFLASKRIKNHIRVTPCEKSHRLSNMLKSNIYLKMENMQHTGAYKERGALNKLCSLSESERSKGVFAASAGNHAQGVAYHAGRLGINSTIFMPLGTPVIKVTRTKQFGATVQLTGSSFDDASQACAEHIAKNGGTLVHPFDDVDVIAGQATIGVEILDQVADVDVIVAQVGGGGMISGVARVAKLLNPKVKIIGVQPAKNPSMIRAVVNNDMTPGPVVTTIADGANVRRVGQHTFAICKELIDEWVSVTDEEICRAILFLLEGEKTVAEGAGATAVAALLSGKIQQHIEGKKVAAIVSGGNIDMNAIAQVIECGLIETGRRIRISMDIPDRPGTLNNLLAHISSHEANVVNVHHERTRMASFGAAKVQMVLDVRGEAHTKEILESLQLKYEGNDTIKLEK